MSSSVGYYVSAADIEAQRRRALRGDVVSALARLADTRARARKVGVSVPAVAGERDVGNASIEELEALLQRATTAIDDATRSVDARWKERWRAELGKAARGTVGTGLSAQDELARARPAPDRDTGALRGALADAESLIERNGHRCDEEGLAAAREVFDELAATTALARARALSLEIAVIVKGSIERRRGAVERESDRARLLELIHDVPPADQDGLRALVTAATDLDAVAETVYQAVERADLAQHRQKVADATAAALADVGCLVGEGFESMLVTETQAVVGLDGQDGYGLLVRLPADGTTLLTAVVRAEDQDATGKRAHAVQSAYCTETLPELDVKLREHGVLLDAQPFLRAEPGRPVPPAPAPLPRRRRTRAAVPKRPAVQKRVGEARRREL